VIEKKLHCVYGHNWLSADSVDHVWIELKANFLNGPFFRNEAAEDVSMHTIMNEGLNLYDKELMQHLSFSFGFLCDGVMFALLEYGVMDASMEILACAFVASLFNHTLFLDTLLSVATDSRRQTLFQYCDSFTFCHSFVP